jgi:YidC/Oxa1 family membrane protein insertase
MIHLAALLASSPTTTVASHAAKSSGSILDPIAKPIAFVLAEIYSLVPNYGVAIMVLSVIWMVLISPLTLKSTRSMLAMQKLQPQLKKLQEEHRNDRAAFATAQMELFREHQVSPFGSCLPMLLPMPVFFALFRVIDGLSHTIKPSATTVLPGCNPATMTRCADPKYLSSSTRMFKDIAVAHGHLNAFGMDLSHNALSSHNGFLAALPFWIVLLVMAGTSYYQSAQMMNRNKAALAANPQMRMMKYLPLLFVVFCIRFPAGVIVYYSMSNVCRIVQQDFMYRFDPKVKALVAQEVEEVEELTHELDEGRPPRGGTGTDSKPKTSGAKGSGGPKRSRFGDLLAQAAEQQQRNAQGKGNDKNAGGKAPQNGTSAGNGRPAGGNGKAPPGRSSNGSANAGKRQPRQGGRTNRKRRGKR